jgi:hypothetical protein
MKPSFGQPMPISTSASAVLTEKKADYRRFGYL